MWVFPKLLKIFRRNLLKIISVNKQYLTINPRQEGWFKTHRHKTIFLGIDCLKSVQNLIKVWYIYSSLSTIFVKNDDYDYWTWWVWMFGDLEKWREIFPSSIAWRSDGLLAWSHLWVSEQINSIYMTDLKDKILLGHDACLPVELCRFFIIPRVVWLCVHCFCQGDSKLPGWVPAGKFYILVENHGILVTYLSTCGLSTNCP